MFLHLVHMDEVSGDFPPPHQWHLEKKYLYLWQGCHKPGKKPFFGHTKKTFKIVKYLDFFLEGGRTDKSNLEVSLRSSNFLQDYLLTM